MRSAKIALNFGYQGPNKLIFPLQHHTQDKSSPLLLMSFFSEPKYACKTRVNTDGDLVMVTLRMTNVCQRS